MALMTPPPATLEDPDSHQVPIVRGTTPLTTYIYYSQDSISNKFGKSTEHAGVLIGETLDKLLTGECSIHDIKTIQVVFRNGRYLTADNRRLWIFKKLEELGECTEIPIRMTRYINPQKNVNN
uniref:Uncharacterized protein n=1 Tax=Magallana gigas TaxID=29159 RepID=A0A8W8JE73_MAGGI